MTTLGAAADDALSHPARRAPKVRGARRRAALSSRPTGPITVQRRVSFRGGIQVARQKIQVGMIRAGKTVTVLAGGDDGGNRSARHRHNANGTAFPPRGKPLSDTAASAGASVSCGHDVLRCAGSDTA